MEVENELAVAGADSKHSGGADNIGSAGAVNPAVQSLQLGQRYTECDQARTASGPGRLTQRVSTTTTVKTI